MSHVYVNTHTHTKKKKLWNTLAKSKLSCEPHSPNPGGSTKKKKKRHKVIRNFFFFFFFPLHASIQTRSTSRRVCKLDISNMQPITFYTRCIRVYNMAQQTGSIVNGYCCLPRVSRACIHWRGIIYTQKWLIPWEEKKTHIENKRKERVFHSLVVRSVNKIFFLIFKSSIHESPSFSWLYGWTKLYGRKIYGGHGVFFIYLFIFFLNVADAVLAPVHWRVLWINDEMIILLITLSKDGFCPEHTTTNSGTPTFFSKYRYPQDVV